MHTQVYTHLHGHISIHTNTHPHTGVMYTHKPKGRHTYLQTLRYAHIYTLTDGVYMHTHRHTGVHIQTLTET
jgi:hypothetical protein